MLKNPIIIEKEYSKESLKKLQDELPTTEKSIILDYPTIYIINDKQDECSYSVYVGETNNIYRRTKEHLDRDIQDRDDWKQLASSAASKIFVIGHEHFNKSLTLDIENRLMQYLTSVESVKYINNRRSNPQTNYYTSTEFESIFSKIWQKLHKHNRDLFPLEKIIRDSAIFKASPFHKLTQEQMIAREQILLKITRAINRGEDGQLIIVEGEAGSGKTVLLSSLFYELYQMASGEENPVLKGIHPYLLVNHDQQLKVYQQIVEKLGIDKNENGDSVTKPTRFINKRFAEQKADVVIVDEAHLLWTQGKQSYRGKNQLQDLIDRAKVVVIVFDRNQILSREQYVDKESLENMFNRVNLNGDYIHLHKQMRIAASDATIDWIRTVIDRQELNAIPFDEKGYEIKIFETPSELQEAIEEKSKNIHSGISRMIATFDWPYISGKRPSNGEKYWNVSIGNWQMPWNLQLPKLRKKSVNNKHQSWAEQEQTIGEIGSTFTIQGFDLNYAGVIIGPSVKFRNGKIIFDKQASYNKKATQRRTTDTGEKLDISDMLLKNELNVLLTRGVNGLYIYAVDDQLREALNKASRDGAMNERD